MTKYAICNFVVFGDVELLVHCVCVMESLVACKWEYNTTPMVDIHAPNDGSNQQPTLPPTRQLVFVQVSNICV